MPRCNAHSPMAYTPGALVASVSSTTMPPRSPTPMPAARASSSRGRMPADTTTMSNGRSASLVARPVTAGSPSTSRVPQPTCT